MPVQAPRPALNDISDSAHWSNKADIGVVVHREDLLKEKNTAIRVVKRRYASEIGLPGEITVVWDEARTWFEVAG